MNNIDSHSIECAIILVPRGRAPFGQHQESRPLASSNGIPFLNGSVNTIDWDQNQSGLSYLTLNMRRVTGSPWIADFRCWTWPEVAILGADQKERGLWGREWCAIYNVYKHRVLRLRSTDWKSSLSPGQTDRNVVASGRKLNLRRNLRWVTKRTRKFPRKYTQVANKNILRQSILYFIG